MGEKTGGDTQDAAGALEIIQLHEVMHAFRQSLIQSAIRSLELPQGSRGLDAGCGIGLQAMMLAEDIG